MRNFFWGGDGMIKKLYWVAWSIVTLPVKEGGLGLNTTVTSFRSRIRSGVWSNVVKVLNNTYVNGVPLMLMFNVKVVNGNSSVFWADSWLGNRRLKTCFLTYIRSRRLKIVMLVYGWVMVNLSQSCDKWCWSQAENGKEEDFNVCSVRNLLVKSRIDSDLYVPKHCKWIPKKCSIFICRAELNRIATVDALFARNIAAGSPICGLCSEEDESVEHLFTSCRLANMLWMKICNWCKCSPWLIFSFRDLIEAHKHAGMEGNKKEALKGIIRIGCWAIWKSRNEARFNNKEVKLEFIFGEVKRMGFLCVSDKIITDQEIDGIAWNWSRQPELVVELREWKDGQDVLNLVMFSNGKDLWFWAGVDSGGFPVKSVK
ncbi:uncharacterized protein LOC110870187 [Helianthus annuus]|uniref:uncharacterized protein LOC110870187 n=1 Tax=Helianthus annuus TaxID=4232 RepID=UPI000B907AC5|nr:uncharacterized protein LOC110870187 [Helianthus annuus]